MAESLRLDITPERYELRNRKVLPFLGPNWLAGMHAKWDEMLSLRPNYLSIDISQLEFVTLLDWLHLVSWVERIIVASGPRQIDLDLLGPSPLRLMDYLSFLEVEHGRPPKIPYTDAELEYSQKKYTLVGFLESLDTYGVLNRPGRGTRVIYPGLSRQAAVLKSFFSSRSSEKPKVVLGLQRVATKEDCRLFLDDAHILNWRHSMDERFRSSPLFESDEIWRVLCHELATNIYEHAGVAGFISARVVGSAIDPKTKGLRSWCRWTYPHTLHPLLKKMKTGFLEICVSDAGQGFVESLRKSVARRSGLAQHSISTFDVLAFAFDELGTCKESQDSWATARHGLCRVLNLVVKYGGGLLLRSSDAEVTYVAEMDRFPRRRNGLGYEAQHFRSLPYPIRGAQLQLILPLIPLFDRPRLAPGRRLLEIGLPESFRTQPDHFRGHLVPLLELLETGEVCVGKEELRAFRSRCERLSLDLLGKRPRHEPLVLDFSGLRWHPAQFETFLYLMQNVLQNRPVLLVEIEDQLVNGVLESERERRPTSINSDLLFDDPTEGRSFGELSERLFLETYGGIHATVLGVTRNGAKHIFGLPSEDYEAALLQLLDAPARIEEICSATPSIEERVMRSILTSANPLFESDAELWSLVWTKEMILVETERAVLAHFDSVAVRSKAWRGRKQCGDKGRERFYIPWSNVWRREFLQASRILNRGRQVDEIAQRLIFRLKAGLALVEKDLSSVRVLVCVSAPAMLLATALHRWWPETSPPAVADLGHYIFLGDWEGLPAITSEGGLVLVQDVLDDGKVTQFVLESLRKQAREVLLVLSFIRFSGEDDNISLQSDGTAIPAYALIEIARPEDCEAPHEGEDDSYDYWVEPRSLRPVKLTTLRREFLRGRDPDLERRNLYLERFDNSSLGCLIMSGHFVYGLRHFATTVDIKRTLESGIGDEIAYWVADLCEGGMREKMLWESEAGARLKGDVTAVLMPLHSQIHYLWPKVERLLAQRGRRQPMWLLEPALFTGNGPGYRLPLQFRRQIQAAVNDLGEGGLEGRGRIRILVLDDAIASGRTATTILATIMGEIKKINPRDSPPESPVEWIRYFAILNQADHANHLLWRNITDIGVPSIQVVREEYAPFMGVTVYDDSDCPLCRDRRRLKQLMKDCEEFGGQGARGWVAERIRELAPAAVDGAHFKEPNRPKLKRGPWTFWLIGRNGRAQGATKQFTWIRRSGGCMN
jgi:hypothetical protein